MSRGKKTLRWIILALFALIAGCAAYFYLSGPRNVPLVISPETTILTGPLRSDGTVDYAAALNEMYGKGVTKENNTAVLLIQAIGPQFFNKNMDYMLSVTRQLDIPVPPADGNYILKFDDYLATKPTLPPIALSTAPSSMPTDLHKELDETMKAPWSAKDHLLVAEWLTNMEQPLAVIVEASKRERFFIPLEPGKVLIGNMFLSYSAIQNSSQAFISRAMLKADGGDMDGAIDDLLTAQRLGRLISQEWALTGHMVGISIDGVFTQAGQNLAASGKLDSKIAMKYLASLRPLVLAPRWADLIDKGERYDILDCIGLCSKGHLENFMFTKSGPLPGNGIAADWNAAAKTVNQWYDRHVAALRIAGYADRKKALEVFDTELRAFKWSTRDSTTPGWVWDIISKLVPEDKFEQLQLRRAAQRNPAGYFMTFINSSSFDLPTQAAQIEASANVNQYLLELSLALAAYKFDKGEYPADLAEVSPAYLKAIPLDPFTDKPFIYKRDGKGYILYSTGPNMADDGGKDKKAGGDDIIVKAE